jgi:hypothetical protein
MTLSCACVDWLPNIAKVNAPIITAVARNPLTAPHYDGLVFKFCPWCGKELERDDQKAAITP